MNKRLWSLFAVVIVLTAVLFFASFERGLTWSSVLVASVAALALFVGALIAPPTWRKPSVEDKIPQQEWEKRKLTQVV
ncbi:MAG: hypothetical protein Q4F65_06725, partial [Propionibacteriaceae bacterium]|nr:hypothetical protein [Propionibacteriaceae bacterium]